MDIRHASIGQLTDVVYQLNKEGYTVCRTQFTGEGYILTSNKTKLVWENNIPQKRLSFFKKLKAIYG